MDFYGLLFTLAAVYVIYKGLRYVSRSSDEPASDWFGKMCESLGEIFTEGWHAYLSHRERKNEYTDLNLRYWQGGMLLINRNFVGRTLLNFKVEYQLSVIAERVNPEEYKKHRMLEESSRQNFLDVLNEQVVEPYLENQSCFFKIEWRTPIALGQIWQIFRTALMQLRVENDEWLLREFPDQELEAAVLQTPFESHGCKLHHVYFKRPRISESIVRENYNMLTEEQKSALLYNESYGAFEEMLAVAAMRRELDFFEGRKQEYQADMYKIEVERAGRAVKIRWTLNDQKSGYYLLGFRNTGGFSKDQWSEDGNGQRIVDASTNGETTEVLADEESYFYTFFLKPWQETPRTSRRSPLRFQVTTAGIKQAEAIKSVLARIEERKKTAVDPDKETLSRALKELGAYVEMDTAFDAMEKSFVEQIGKSDYSDAEKQRKIERLQDFVRQVRSKYEP